MKVIKHKLIEILLLTFFFKVVNGFPTAQPESKDTEGPWEKVYPNGTVLGEYHYKDKDGTPVHVNYYADNSRYGVELNSVKIIKEPNVNTTETIPTSNIKRTVEFDTIELDSKKHPRNSDKFKAQGAILQYLNKEAVKTKNRKQKASPEYETFLLSNNLEGSTQCAKTKVRVYNIEPEKRKARAISDEDYNENVCQRY